MTDEELEPNGTCWCGCGSGAAPGAFFLPGHERAAEGAVVRLVYGGVPQFLMAHGFGPGGRSAIKELAALQRGEQP